MDLITIQECCDLLKVSRPTFLKIRKEHSLAEYKVGKRIRYSKKEIYEKIANLPSLGHQLRQPQKDALSFDDFQLEEIWGEDDPINLDDLGFVDAFTACSLLVLILGRLKRGKHVEITAGSNEKASYLASLDFFNQVKRFGKGNVFIDPKLVNVTERMHPEIILPISTVGFKGAERRYTSDIRRVLKTQGFSDYIGDYIGWTLGELADNSHTHSNSNGLCFISIERISGEINFLQINIVDCGDGIPDTLRKNQKYSQLDEDTALLLAFKSNVSSWPDEHERGKGLTDLLKIAFECNSHFRAECGGIAYRFYCKGMHALINKIRPSIREQGTRFSITLIDDEFREVKRTHVDAFLEEYMEKR